MMTEPDNTAILVGITVPIGNLHFLFPYMGIYYFCSKL